MIATWFLPLFLALASSPSTNSGTNVPKAEPPVKAPLISLEMFDTDVRDALRLVAKQAGVNLVMSNRIEGAITLDLDQVSLKESLDAIVGVTGFEYSIDGNIASVYTLEELLEQERKRTEYETAQNAAAAAVQEVLVLDLRYVDAERVQAAVEGLLSETGKISLLKTTDHLAQGFAGNAQAGLRVRPNVGVQPNGGAPNVNANGLQIGTQLASTSQGMPARSHTLVVLDHPERLARIQEVVDKIDVKPVQVVIEARFVEVMLDNALKLGIDWNVFAQGSGASMPHTFPFGDSSLGSFNPNVDGGGAGGGAFPNAPNLVTTPTTPGLFTFGTLDFSSFSAVLELIQTDSRVQVVSNPRVVVGDRHTATILVGERFPILSANISEFGNVTEQLDRYEPIGVQLEVTPSVLNEDEIELFVRPSSSSLGALVAGSTGISVARINSRQIDTSVTVRDRQTVVLGGLITSREVESETRVPFLGSLPLLGRLFRSDTTEVERVDLVVFLTVGIVQENGLTETQRKLFEQTSLDGGETFRIPSERSLLDYSSAGSEDGSSRR